MNTLIDEILERLMPAYEKQDVYNVDHEIYKAKSELLKAIMEVIGDDEDNRWVNDKDEVIQDYEDACDKESRNQLRQELRTKFKQLFGEK